jgi:TetR/AcrR family transcriptional repressor of lmrAB and yxaGH operons
MLRTAGRLFRAQGFDGTGLQQVLDESGAPRGSLYFHFPGGKEQLAVEAVERYRARVRRWLDEGLDASPDAAQGFERLIGAYADAMTGANYREGCLVASVALDAGAESAALCAAAEHAFEDWVEAIASRLERDGWTNSAARSAAMYVIAALEGALLMCRAAKTTEPLLAVARESRRALSARRSAGSARAPAELIE